MRRGRSIRCDRDRRHCRGFVLLIVLALIAVTGLYAAGTAKASMAIVLESAARQEELQEHWARESLKSVVLRNAQQILMPPGRAKEVRTAFSHRVRLGGTSYELLLADEDAKLPLNTIRRMLDPETVVRLVQSAVPGVRLRSDDNKTAPFGAWEEALKFDQKAARPQVLAQATLSVTLWGSGRLNINRARPQIVSALISEVFGAHAADRVQENSGGGRVASTEKLAAQMNLNLEDRQKLEQLIGTSSSSYSLWILPVSGHRAEFHVAEQVAQRQSPVTSLLW